MYVKRGMKEIVCLKMEMGLREEEKREFDEFVLLCLRLGGGEFFFYYLFIYRVLVLGRRKFLVLGFEVFIFLFFIIIFR